LERWLWQEHRAGNIHGSILDIGVVNARRWMGPGYWTFGERNCDVNGDLLTLTDYFPEPIDTIICTEVLEHVTKPQRAVNQMLKVLKPGGRLYVVAPFFWPWHGIEGAYNDYWRFTSQGWRLLLKDFQDVTVTRIQWTREGAWLYDLLRQHEAWGMGSVVEGATGYLVMGVKGAAA
jgi:SAM-dependent methyltransferase